MKKSVVAFVLFLLIGLSSVGADTLSTLCNPKVQLINQDPYPANPGEYVKVVFQIDGLNNPNCKSATFELQESFPLSMDPDEKRVYEFAGANYVRDFSSIALVPYELLVDEDAVDGDSAVEGILKFTKTNGETVSQVVEFQINIEGIKVDFEVSVKDFEAATNTLTLELLNIGENDVEALAVEIPKQENIVVKGSNRNIVGNLDANEDTTVKYEASPKEGELELIITYNDPLNVRRQMSKSVYYDPSYFTDRKANETQPPSTYFYLFYLLLIIMIVVWGRGWWKRRKKRALEKNKR